MDKEWFLLFTILIILGYFAFSGFKTVNVILNYEEDYNQGDKLAGDLIIGIEEGDSLDVKTPILVSLAKENEVIASETMDLEKFIELSGANIVKIKREGEYFYETPGIYRVPLSNVIEHDFNEKGQYELVFSLVKLDIIKITKITVN